MNCLLIVLVLGLALRAQAVVYEECVHPDLHPGLKAIWQKADNGLSELHYEFQHDHTEHLQHLNGLQLRINNGEHRWSKSIPICGPDHGGRIVCHKQLFAEKLISGSVQLPFPYDANNAKSELWLLENTLSTDTEMQVVYKLCTK